MSRQTTPWCKVAARYTTTFEGKVEKTKAAVRWSHGKVRIIEEATNLDAGFTITQIGGWDVELPIPFDGWGNMEVDLLDAKTRVVIELDGGQHFASAEAYRRDRRKDALLREHGYVVLRFLAEDVDKQLDRVLGTILRVLSSRERESAG